MGRLRSLVHRFEHQDHCGLFRLIDPRRCVIAFVRPDRGIALAALGIIYYEDMVGIITTIPNIDCSPIYLVRTVDLFESLVLSGHIPKWDGTFEEAD